MLFFNFHYKRRAKSRRNKKGPFLRNLNLTIFMQCLNSLWSFSLFKFCLFLTQEDRHSLGVSLLDCQPRIRVLIARQIRNLFQISAPPAPPPNQLNYNEYINCTLSVGSWVGNGEEWPPAPICRGLGKSSFWTKQHFLPMAAFQVETEGRLYSYLRLKQKLLNETVPWDNWLVCASCVSFMTSK